MIETSYKYIWTNKNGKDYLITITYDLKQRVAEQYFGHTLYEYELLENSVIYDIREEPDYHNKSTNVDELVKLFGKKILKELTL